VAENGKDPAVPTIRLQNLSGRRSWLTEDGPVVIDVEGDTALMVESLDELATEKLEQGVFGTAAGK